MTGERSERDQVDQLAEDFVARYRRGERPSVTEYARRYPELADQISDVLQALVAIEEFGPGQDAARRDRLPPVLGEYRLVREVGRGGMGVVYEAEQVTLGRRVAVKVLPPDPLQGPTHLERFRREAQAAARLHHTNIVPVYGVGEVDGVCYYAMQFIRGQPLNEVLREVRRLREAAPPGATTAGGAGRPEPATSSASLPGLSDATGRADGQHYFRRVAHVGAQVADALAYAHAQGVLHRDVKPANLLLDVHGAVWVTDFGLAKAEGAGELTRAGDVVGTLRYMAPERFDGRSDPRSDVYSLGLTLYELLTLRPAFEESDRGRLVAQVLHAEPRRPRKIDRLIPRDLETIILKATAKDPGRRYQTAAEMAEDLRRLLADRPIRGRRTRLLERARLWARRNPAVATLSLCVAALLLVVGVGLPLTVLWYRERDHALTNLERAERAEREMTAQSHLAHARAHRFSGRPGQRFESLDTIAKAVRLTPGPAVLDELRDEAIACLALPDIRPVREWEGRPPGSAHNMVHTADLSYSARCDPSGAISVCRAGDAAPAARLMGEGGEVVVGFSPDGRFLATRHGRDDRPNAPPFRARVWDWRCGTAVVDEPAPGPRAPVFGFSPDGRLVAIGLGSKPIAVFDLANGAAKRDGLLDAGFVPEQIVFHPDGSRLVVVSPASAAVRVLGLAGEPARTLTHPAGAHTAAWHPDGAVLAVGCGTDIYLWDAVGGRRRGILRGHYGRVNLLAFGAAGDLLLSGSWDGSGRLWDPWEGRQLLTFPGKTAPPAWGERGIAGWVGTRLQQWEAIPGREYRALPGAGTARGHAHTGAVSPDGRWLVAASENGLHVWDLALGRKAAHLPVGRTVGIAFHPSGRELFTSGDAGLRRWPLRTDAAAMHVGLPTPMPVPGLVRPLQRVAVDRDARTLAVVGGKGLAVLDLTNPSAEAWTAEHHRAATVVLSPDGRWVATATWDGEGVKVWPTRRGPTDPIDLMPDVPRANLAFSPDGRWLVAGTAAEFRAWEVGTWRPGPRVEREAGGDVPRTLAFSPDGRVMALATSDSVIQLRDAVTFNLLARLQSPHPDRQDVVGFDRDGGLLATFPPVDGARVWDLRRLREGLREIGLDWDQPPCPPAPVRPPPLPVRADLGRSDSGQQPASPINAPARR
jgi:serine/threonine protein kinase/WD40 repeat protein